MAASQSITGETASVGQLCCLHWRRTVKLDERHALSDSRCWRCGEPAAVIVTHLHNPVHNGSRSYCAGHFLALGSLPSGAACAPTLELRRHAVEIRNCA